MVKIMGSTVTVVVVTMMLVAAAAAMAAAAAAPSNAYWTAYYDPNTNLYSVSPTYDPVNGGTPRFPPSPPHSAISSNSIITKF
jgi:hypothetical protein